ncbi:Ku protein [Acetobacteraceae bacterium H6797]|nr:Ku protein [Acetobacteraceae bacterium H6797]
MAERPLWRGYLRLALVTCPVVLITARREKGGLHFNYINPETGHRIRMITVDAETGEELERRSLVKGYEFQKDHYVLLEDEDFEAARIESSSNITISKVLAGDTIDPLYFDASYYLLPDGDAGEEVYAVLRDALAKSGAIALSRIVLNRRERPVAIMASGKGIVLHTLHEEGDLLSAEDAFASLGRTKSDPGMVKLAEQLLERQADEFDPADTEDRYEARLRELIDAKIKGEGFVQPEEEEPPSNVVDLMAALKASLGKEKARAPAGKASVASLDEARSARGKSTKAPVGKPASRSKTSARKPPVKKNTKASTRKRTA